MQAAGFHGAGRRFAAGSRLCAHKGCAILGRPTGVAMAETEMVMVFCYDVSDSRNRRRVAGVLEERAVRVQDSVFEARMTPRRAHALFRAAAGALGDGDSLRLYAVGAAGLRVSRTVGGAPLPEDHDFHLF